MAKTTDIKPKVATTGAKPKVFALEDNCMGCGLCEVACTVEHSASRDVRKGFRGPEKGQTRIWVERKGSASFAIQCRHCEDSPCITACMTGAMEREPETGAVLVDEEKCVGCWMCIMACPYGVISRSERGREVAIKCDLCPGRETPMCVVACPNRALVYGAGEEAPIAAPEEEEEEPETEN